MLVTCDKSGMPTTTASFKSSTKGMLAGNIIFGGAIGAGVDMASGAAYDYPALLHIMMNDGITQATATTLPAPAATTPVSGGAN
jgi:phosphoketolase